MIKKNILAIGAFLAFGFANAQHRSCGTQEMMSEFYKQNPDLASKKTELNRFLSTNDYKAQARRTVVTIPIVVHVLYKNATQNISDAQILSQIAVLNADFRKLNTDFSTVVPSVFQGVAADMEVQFCLATKTPTGAVTTGIERKSVASTFNFNNNYYQSTGLSAWDPTKYLNIWVGDMTGGYLGWAYMPAAHGYPFDGLAIGYLYFGNTGTAQYPYNKGRTATHEIGHYFGLNHIWGDDLYACGTVNGDDGCADTPATSEEYYGSPVFPDNSYMCTPTANGAMFMNYMDYVNDASMAMFTNDQKTILQNTLLGPRASLLNSNGCSVLGLDEVEVSNSIVLFPNPAVSYISIASPVVKINEVEIFSADGRLVKRAFIKNEVDKIDVKELTKGTYFVRTYNDKDFVKSLKFIKE